MVKPAFMDRKLLLSPGLMPIFFGKKRNKQVIMIINENFKRLKKTTDDDRERSHIRRLVQMPPTTFASASAMIEDPRIPLRLTCKNR